MRVLSGSCLCKGVTFEVTAPVGDVQTCHCTQCQKTSGHFSAAVHVPAYQIELLRHETLKWFQSMDPVSKGFCVECGSSLFWNFSGRDGWSISAGSFDAQTNLKISHHCFVSEKSDYYQIADDLEQAPQFDLAVSQAPQKSNQINSKE